MLPLRCDGPTASLLRLSVNAVKNGTATLSYREEFARIPILAQAPIWRCGEILLQYRGSPRHIRHESRTQAARFLFSGTAATDGRRGQRRLQSAPSVPALGSKAACFYRCGS
jgi:hypothetical protein